MTTQTNSNDSNDSDARTIYCSNLADKVSESLLYELFLQAGPIERVSIPKEKDGSQRSYGFITYKHQPSVPFALAIYSGTKLFNRDLRMNNRNANCNGNKSVNDIQMMIQKEQRYSQTYQLEKFHHQMIAIQNAGMNAETPPIDGSSQNLNERKELDKREAERDRMERDRRERDRSDRDRSDRDHRSDRDRLDRDRSERDRPNFRTDRDREREKERIRPKDISALKGSVALPTMSAQNMLPSANMLPKKPDDLLSKSIDINALLNFGANMQLQSPLGNGNSHHLQPKIMHRHENRPHHQNNNYSRWFENDRRGNGHGGRDDRGNDRRDRDRGRNRHDRR